MADEKFHLVSNYAPTGDQPQAIQQLVEGVERGDRCQTLLGVTGSGKTFTMANVIAQCNRPTLVLAHNKTLAAQLCTEFRSFFPDNAVEYFVSYYDYYQPEAYIPSTDTYIEKDSAINDEIDRLRHSATAALSERRDVIIVASVSCIYSLGDPIDYRSMVISLRPGMEMERDALCKRLVTLQYERNDINFIRNKFRVHGDTVDIYLAYMSDLAIRVEFFGDEIDRIIEFNPVTGAKQNVVKHVAIFPASHYIVSAEKKAKALEKIRAECDAQVKQFTAEGKLIEAQRIQQRTNYDIEMLTEVGICKGIENYSAVLSGRAPGSMPTTLLDYFPDDFLLFVDESHVTLPQVRAMYGGDYARKKTLVEYGFRLPSAFDNRPLKFEEVESKLNQMIFVSATPGEYERQHADQVVEQVIRPTGLTDPEVIVKPIDGDCGSGIEKLYKKDFDDVDAMWAYVKRPEKRFGICEEVIRQHPQAAALHPDSINCIRVATFVKDGEPLVIYAACKAGTGGMAFDNMGRGGITMRFDLDTGKIAGQGHDEELKKYDRHPTTGIELKGYQMPMHEEVKALALKAALMYPEFHYVGWDICMTEKGPAIIEGNDYPGYDLAQIPDDGDPHPRQGLIPRFEKFGIEV